MYVRTPTGFLDLMSIHPEWNAREHRYTPLGRNWWRLDFLMVDDGPGEGRRRNPSVPFTVTFNNAISNDWQGTRIRLFYWLEDLKNALSQPQTQPKSNAAARRISTSKVRCRQDASL